MGFTNGTGPEGTPTINNTPQTVADLTRLRDLVIERGNRFKGTTTQRNTFTTAGFAVEGHEWFDTTLSTPLIRRGGAWKREVSFRQFATARSAITDGALWAQVPTEDTSKDTEPAFTFAYNSTDAKVTPEAGVYLLHATAHPGGATTGVSFVQLRAATQGLLAIGGVSNPANPWSSCFALFRTDGTEGFYVEVQKQTGGASNSTGSLRVTKLTTI